MNERENIIGKLINMYLMELEDNYHLGYETVWAKDLNENFKWLLSLEQGKHYAVERINDKVKTFFNYLRELGLFLPIGYEDNIVFENGEFIDKNPMEERFL